MKKIVLSLILSLISLSTVYSIDKATFKVGKSFFDRKLFSEAEKRFLDIVRKYPDSTLYHQSLFYLGNTYANMGNYKQALQYYKLLMTKSRTIADKQQAILGIAKSWLQLGIHDKAGDFYSFYATEYPESQNAPAALYFAGIARERDNNIPAAIEKYRAVLDNYPDSSYYNKSIEKIAVLDNSTPESLWMASTPKQDTQELTNAWDTSFESTDFRSQNAQVPVITTPPVPVINSNIVTVPVAPQVITQFMEPTIITQQITTPPIIVTQTLPAQVVTQQITMPTITQQVTNMPPVIVQTNTPEVTSTTSNTNISRQVVQQRNGVFNTILSPEEKLKQEELEQYKKLWEQEYQERLKTQELEQAQQDIKQLIQLSENKAQVLGVKEQSLAERQSQLEYEIYKSLKNIPQEATPVQVFTNAPAFLTPADTNSVQVTTTINTIINTTNEATTVETPANTTPTESTTPVESTEIATEETPTIEEVTPADTEYTDTSTDPNYQNNDYYNYDTTYTDGTTEYYTDYATEDTTSTTP